MTVTDTKISTSSLLTALTETIASGEYPCGLTGWAEFWTERNYKQAGEALRVIRAHLEALPAESSEISRANPVLRWNSLGPGVVYTVEVLTDELNPVALGRDLRKPEFRLPAGTEGLLRGTRGLVWRVQARYPDGRERQSRRFRQRLSAGSGG